MELRRLVHLGNHKLIVRLRVYAFKAVSILFIINKFIDLGVIMNVFSCLCRYFLTTAAFADYNDCRRDDAAIAGGAAGAASGGAQP